MHNKNNISNLDIIIKNMENDKNEIIERWLEEEGNFSLSKRIFNKKLKAILKIFGSKILEHIFDLVMKDKKTGIFDTVTVIMEYFLQKNFTLVDMYRNYSDLKNVTLFYYIEKFPELKDKFYYPLANLFDKNFILFINEFLLDMYDENIDIKEEIENNNEELSNEAIEDKLEIRRKDIRFTKRDVMTAAEFIEDLDYGVFDKVDSMLEDVDELVVLIYSLDENDDTEKSIEIIEEIATYLDEIPELLVSLGIFEIIERAFENLIDFLSTITEEILSDKKKKSLLVNLLLALVHDFENWLKVIFIEQTAQDIHYFDASFRANILNIEKVFEEENDENNEDCEIDFF